MQQNTFEKKLARGNAHSMIHLLVHVLLQLVIFMKQQKSLRKNIEWFII